MSRARLARWLDDQPVTKGESAERKIGILIASGFGISALYLSFGSQDRGVPLWQRLQYQKDGVVLMRGLLKDDLSNLSLSEFTTAVEESMQRFIRFSLKDMGCDNAPNADEDSTYSLNHLVACRERLVARDGDAAYINPVQYIHVHRHSERIRAIAESATLGKAAHELLGVRSVRLYQTAAFIKAPAAVAARSTPVDRLASTSSATAWHADLNQVPLDTNNFGTFWCPLTRVTRSHSTLTFARGSHRDVAVRHWFRESSGLLRNESAIGDDARNATAFIASRNGPLVDFGLLEAGDCTFHSGWLLHAAPPNLSGEMRRALTFTYVDADATLLGHNTRGLAMEDKISWAGWVDAVYENGSTIDHPDLPLTYSGSADAPSDADAGNTEFVAVEPFDHPGTLP